MALPCESLLLRLNILHDETGPMAKALGLRVKFELLIFTYSVDTYSPLPDPLPASGERE